MESLHPSTFQDQSPNHSEIDSPDFFNEVIKGPPNESHRHQVIKRSDVGNWIQILDQNFDLSLNKIYKYPEVKEAYNKILQFIRLIYSTSNWSNFVKQIEETCSHRLSGNIIPGTIGAFLLGRIKKTRGLKPEAKNCTPYSIDAIPSDNDIGSCDQSVLIATWKNNRYVFILCKKNNQSQKAIIFIPSGRRFYGFSSDEKSYLRENGYYFVSIYHWDKENNSHFYPIYPDPLPLKDIINRGLNNDEGPSIPENGGFDESIVIIIGIILFVIALFFAWRMRR